MKPTPHLALLGALVIMPAVALDTAGIGNSEAITSARLKTHLEYIASDELEGRNTPSKGLDLAAEYIVSHLKSWGVKPAGEDGTYFQKIPLRNPQVNTAATTLSIGGTALKYGEQFVASGSSGTAQAPIVYIGDGYHRPGHESDPYAKVDVKGKVLLTIPGRPSDVSFRDVRDGKVLSPQAAAAKFGAVGVIVASADSDEQWKMTIDRGARQGRQELAMPSQQPAATAGAPVVTVRAAALGTLLQGERISATDLPGMIEKKAPGEPFALRPAKTAKLAVKIDDNTVYTRNVIAMIEGSDPKLKAEYVAIGAHYDHVGVRATGDGDKIFNGADDDGSGTVGVLEIAHAFATGVKPKRSILFVWHAGEERGLWGSRYFVEKPTVPINQIVTQLNIDMIGRSKKPGDTNPRNDDLTGPNAVYLVGQSRMSTEVGQLAADVNNRMHKLTYDGKHDDPNHPERIFFRSDHINYAMKGIPILFWFTGTHEDYHQVSDHVDKIDFEKLEKITQTIYATALELGNKPTRPVVDKPLELNR